MTKMSYKNMSSVTSLVVYTMQPLEELHVKMVSLSVPEPDYTHFGCCNILLIFLTESLVI